MSIKSIISMNLKIMKAVNSCERAQYMPLLDEIMDMKESEMWKIFTKKYYLWNLLRGKDFYKTLAVYVIDKVNSDVPEDMNRAELAIKVGIATANKDKDCKAFVKTILRNVSVLTVDTIRYTTNEKLEQLLSEPEGIIADEKMTVVLKTVSDMKSQISALQSIME